MKIGIITDAIDDEAKGIGNYVRNLVNNLIKIDKDNDYYLIHHKMNENEFYKNRKEIIIKTPNIPLGREIRKIYLMPKILNKYNLDIVHETAQIGPFFTKSKFKKVLTVCDLAPLIIPESQTLRRKLHHKIAFGINLKKADKIISISETTKKDIIRFFSISDNKIKITHLAASNIFKKISPEESKKVLEGKYKLTKPFFFFSGTIEPRKNLINAMEAFEKFKIETNFDYELVFAADKGWKSNKILKRIDRLSKFGVKLLEKVPHTELPYFYNNAEALIYPSFYEGFGLPILEAMKCNCSVITSNTSSMPEVAGYAAILVNPRNVDEIKNSMKEIAKNQDLKKKLIIKGSKQAEKFNWENCAKETLKIYKELY